ncbi:MAG: RagB/SusD family nutrient uptake outer membrane protein [Prevotella sp.]|nr:RagB/SusD family nutrient uptake outer membrane protein [Prevotella sp.]
MKLNIAKIMVPAAAFLLAASVTSCMKDLEKGNIDPNVQAEADINALYAKCYAGLIMEGNDGNADFTIRDAGRSTLVRNVYNFNVLPTDEGICWWSDGGIVDISYNQCVPSTETLNFLYYRLISNIAFCNHFLELGADATLTAEVRFLRAYNYYLMLDFFGDPPFTTTISTEIPKQAHAYNGKFSEGMSRAQKLALGREFLFNWIQDELLAAEANMMEPSPKTDAKADNTENFDYGRADKAAVWFLLSRLYLNAGTYLNNDGQNNPYWDKALEYAEKVINSGYKLFTEDMMTTTAKNNDYQPYDLLFMGDNGFNGASIESVLTLKQDGVKTHGWGGTLFFLASTWDNTMETVTGLGRGTTEDGWAGMRCRRQLIEKFTSNPESFEGKTTAQIRDMHIDDRALFWGVGHTVDLGNNTGFAQGLVTTKWNNNYSTNATPHDPHDVDIDYFLFRVAEMYLTAAEAEMHINGVTSAKAKGYIDNIRNRAHAATKPSYSLQDVLDERAREFYFEGLRRTDLIRYNQFGGQDNYNWDYKNGIADGSGKIRFDKAYNVFPLPSSEVRANTNITQIDGYPETE